ncbi:MAG: glycine--tRNA ligase [Anaerofustis stercorihominis]|nr:glycine--tRNA ligase [Anaerofustis stercorihominis]
MSKQLSMNEIISITKMRGIIFPGSEIYEGLANSWDYGPIGVMMLNNVKSAWTKKFITESKYNVGLDSSILLNPRVWEASGHLSNFNDPLMDCKQCKSRYRADKLIEEDLEKKGLDANADGWSNEKMESYIADNGIACPKCGNKDFTSIRQFNLMFKTFQGVTEDSTNTIYLRPETAQGIFINFKNVQRTTRKKLPFGIGQIGKAFRNEITPGNFIFRTREFEQMELEFFCHPDEEMKWFDYWRSYCMDFLLSLGIKQENLRYRDHAPEQLSHYSNATTDIEYAFPFGIGELWGIADRTDYDLKQHEQFSGKDMRYIDPITNEKFHPYCIEPSVGANRLLLAILCDGFENETLADGTDRNVFRVHPYLAAFKAAVLPLSKKLNEKAEEIYDMLLGEFPVDYDDAGNIGKRYRRQDEIGTPFCITVDFDTEVDGCVTIRERDTMEQVRIPVAEVVPFIRQRIKF